MSEKIANELLLALGSGNASVQTAINLVNEFGVARVQGYLQEMAAGGQRSDEVKAGLMTSLLCCSDKLGDVLRSRGIQTHRRTIMRAVKQTQVLVPALKRLLAGKETEEDLELAWAAIAQAGNEAPAGQAAREAGGQVPATPEQGVGQGGEAPEQSGPAPSPVPRVHARPLVQASRPLPGQSAPAPASDSEGAQNRDGIHIYGGKGALAFEPCSSRSGKLALTVDAAVATGVRQYDWRNKIIIQLTEKEMLLLFAVLRGWLSRFEATAHGQANDKSFSIENQATKFYVKVVQKGRPMVTLPVEPGDAALVVMMLGTAIVKHQPMLGDLQGVDRLVKPMTEMMLTTPARQAA
ncbi:MAG: hypothetical protein ACRERX_17930 [Pseudomonas sp.]